MTCALIIPLKGVVCVSARVWLGFNIVRVQIRSQKSPTPSPHVQGPTEPLLLNVRNLRRFTSALEVHDEQLTRGPLILNRDGMST